MDVIKEVKDRIERGNVREEGEREREIVDSGE